METIRITLKNYRCFSDQEPLYFEIRPGLTSLVGPNNSGKSAIKLLFYEFRHFFEILSNHLNLNPSLNNVFAPGGGLGTNYQGVSDPQEIFTNGNQRPLSIEIEVPPPPQREASGVLDYLVRIFATCDRNVPTSWRFECYGQNQPNVPLSTIHAQAPSANDPFAIRWPTVSLDCRHFMDSMAILRDARYYGPFRNAVNQGAGDHFDLRVGTGFVQLWNEWKTAGIRAQMNAIDAVTDDIRRLFEFDRLEVNTSAKLQTLIVSINGRSYRLNELGSGLAQFIIVLGNAATQPPSLLLIDEPETNLHPSLQTDFLLSLARYAKHGIIFSTHSVGLVH